jgi:DnaJ-class molecular chaperone
MGLSNGETRRQLADGVVTRTCYPCHGSGRLTHPAREQRALDRGTRCPICHGTGEVVIRAPQSEPWGGPNP